MITMTREVYVNEFIDGYVTCGLWADTWDESGHLVDAGDSDLIDEGSWVRIREVCGDFVNAQWDDLQALESLEVPYLKNREGSIAEYAGHNFWLTQNGHGTGFWDRGLGELGDRLTVASKPYGSASFFTNGDTITYEG